MSHYNLLVLGTHVIRQMAEANEVPHYQIAQRGTSIDCRVCDHVPQQNVSKIKSFDLNYQQS